MKTRRCSSVRGVDLTRVPISVLQQMITQKAKKVERLMKRRDRLTMRLKTLDRKIQEAGGPARHEPRARNNKTLVETIQRLPGMKTGRQVKDITKAVQEAGYKTKSCHFRVIVNQALLNHPKIFKKVGRGKYTLGTGRKHRKPQASNPSTQSTTSEQATMPV